MFKEVGLVINTMQYTPTIFGLQQNLKIEYSFDMDMVDPKKEIDYIITKCRNKNEKIN